MTTSENIETAARTNGVVAWAKAIAARFLAPHELHNLDEKDAVKSAEPRELRDTPAPQGPQQDRDPGGPSLPFGPCCC